MELLSDNLPFILHSLSMTLLLGLTSVTSATIVAVGLGTCSVASNAPIRVVARTLVEIARDVPLIVNVFFVFFGAPLVGFDLTPFWAVTVTLAIWGGGNGAEIVRGGLQAVPWHQIMSSKALGMRGWETFMFVQAPQAFQAILPPYVSLVAQVVQATSIGALVGVGELLRSGQVIVERTAVATGESPAFLVYGAILAIYFVICWLLARFGRMLETGDRSVTSRGASSPQFRLGYFFGRRFG